MMKKLFGLMILLVSGFQLGAQENMVVGDVRVHDPVMIEADGRYHIFCTGHGVSMFVSDDMKHWQADGQVFSEGLPAWHKNDIPKQKGHLWAPDIHYRDGKYHLYYSVSAWMNFNSSIGYASNTTLDRTSKDYKWVDHGKVIDFRNGGKGVNVIDPMVHEEADGSLWLYYGSYQSGLRLVELNEKTGLLKTDQPELHTLTASLGEGVFVLKSGDYYYIFASRGICCKGNESNYQVVMGRSESLFGPFLNKKGESWLDNKYTLMMAGDEARPGRGHNGFFTQNDTTFIVYHAYTRAAEGRPLLNIQLMYLDADGWPSVEKTGQLFKHTND